MLRVLLTLALLAPPWPTSPPVAMWRDPAHIIIMWSQGVDGERCFSRETPAYDYGCQWGWQGPNTVILPRPDRPALDLALPQAGDTIVVGEERAIVPIPHFAFLPMIGQ